MVPLKGISNSILEDGFAGVCRNNDYLNYKTYGSTKVIRVGKTNIWLNNKYGLMFGDIAGISEANFDMVIDELKSIARKTGVRQIQFHCTPGTTLHHLFSQHYTPIPSYPILFQDFGSSIAPENIKFTFADIDIF